MMCRYPEWLICLITAVSVLSIQLLIFGCYHCLKYIKNPPKKGFELLIEEQNHQESTGKYPEKAISKKEENPVPKVYIPGDFNTPMTVSEVVESNSDVNNPPTEFFTRTYQQWDLENQYVPSIPDPPSNFLRKND